MTREVTAAISHFRLRLWYMIPVVAVCLFAFSSVILAASFVVVEVQSFGQWRSVLYRNTSSDRLFCALESKNKETTFRINHYKDNGETFLEIFDPTWTMMEGTVRFSIEFKREGQETMGLEFQGKSWGDSYTYDILDKNNFDAVLGLIAVASNITIKNSNDSQLITYDADGSSSAVRDFLACLGVSDAAQ